MSDVNEKKLAMPLADEDALLPFQLERSVIRGRIVRLGPSLDDILSRHQYPLSVARLLAKASAMAAALGSALKFDGIFTLQTQTDGPVSRLVVDVTSDGAVRACASFEVERVTDVMSEAKLLGQGHLVFTLDQKISDERYQGIVKLEGGSLTEAFQLYFKQSEQIPTGLITAAGQDAQGRWHAGCLMLQKMPREGGGVDAVLDDTAQEDDWHRAMLLMQTCSEGELTNAELSFETLLFRLFHEEEVRVYDRRTLRHECRCSREKIEGVLRAMPAGEMSMMADADGLITVTCQFCNRAYAFEGEGLGHS